MKKYKIHDNIFTATKKSRILKKILLISGLFFLSLSPTIPTPQQTGEQLLQGAAMIGLQVGMNLQNEKVETQAKIIKAQCETVGIHRAQRLSYIFGALSIIYSGSSRTCCL